MMSKRMCVESVWERRHLAEQ